MNEIIPMVDLDSIPHGSYCYEVLSYDNETGRLNLKSCPYWLFRGDKPDMMNGECTAFGIRDWEVDYMSLLWDGVKECGVNNE